MKANDITATRYDFLNVMSEKQIREASSKFIPAKCFDEFFTPETAPVGYLRSMLEDVIFGNDLTPSDFTTATEAKRKELKEMAEKAKQWEIKNYGNTRKSDYAHMVLCLMDTEEHSCNYCSSLREVLGAFPEVCRWELEKELDKFL